MSEIKRHGAVLLIQAGDAQIAEALTDGIMAGRAARLEADERRAVEAEIDRQAIARGASVDRHLLRVAVGNTKTPEDYGRMMFQAAVDYGEPVYCQTRAEKVLKAALGIYGLFCVAVAEAFRAQDKVLEGRE